MGNILTIYRQAELTTVISHFCILFSNTVSLVMEQLVINAAGLLNDLGRIDSAQLVIALAALPSADLQILDNKLKQVLRNVDTTKASEVRITKVKIYKWS